MIPAVVLLFVCAFACTAHADSHLISVASNFGFADEPELRYAERDARAMRDVLKQFSTQQQFHEYLLLGPNAARLEQTIRRLVVHPDDSLYVYYSGHADRDGLHLGDTLLEFSVLKDAVESVGARVKLLIIDACRAGGITRIKGGRPAVPFSIVIEDRLNIAGTAIITSSADSEDSQESEDLGASFFTFHFLQGLRGAADRDQDRLVTLNEAFGYASRQTLRSTALTDQLQHPMFKGRFLGQGAELVLSRLDRPAASAAMILPGPGLYLVFDRQDELFAEINVDGPQARYLIPAGNWLIQKRRSGGAEEQWIQVSSGEERTVSASAAKLVRLTRLDAKGRADHGRTHRLQLLGGATATAIEGHAPIPSIWFGYRRAFSSLELVGEVLFARGSSVDEAYGARVHLDYAFNLRGIRLGAGVLIAGNVHRQRAPQRATQFYGGIGALAFTDLKLSGPLALRLEGGPVMNLIKVREPSERAKLATLVGWSIAGGPTWGF